MTPTELSLLLALLGGTCALAALLMWKGGDAGRDIALMGGVAIVLGGLAAAMLLPLA